MSKDAQNEIKPINVKELIEWLSLLDERQEVWVYSHLGPRLMPLEPQHHIDRDKSKNRIVFDA